MLKKGLSIALLLVGMSVGFTGCAKVETGHVGVESVLGKMKMEELPPGVYQTLTKDVKVISTRETTVSITNIHPKTKDNVTMQDFDVDIRYMIEPSKVADTLSILAGDLTVNEDGDQVVGERFVKRHALEAVFSAAAKYDSSQIHLKRDQIAADIVSELQKSLNKDMKGTFIIPGATVRSLVTDHRLEQAITRAAQIEFDISRKKEELKLAEADAQVIKTRAQAQADANHIIATSLTPMLIRKMEIEAQQAFAGQGTHTVLLPSGGGTPLINVNK
ncbi:SPFH domain-containing protein [Acinetobacter brisouii]|uniref:SPFH domain-containing protein n=1 Tax=Acinetobacter brisouii TaxID=396323 RepID=UPI00124EB9E0|nr:SPFH domain-containing protein [Acinetobacter brisouii]